MNWRQSIAENLVLASLVGAIILVGMVGKPSVSHAQGQWTFGGDVGFLADTLDDTVFALGFNADYHIRPDWSVGPMIQLAPAGDLTQIGVAGVGRYHVRVGAIRVSPFVGIGFVHADLERGAGPGRIDDSDTSYMFPFGITAEYPVARSLTLASTLTMNVQDLSLDRPAADDHFNIGLLFGFRFNP